MMLLCAHMVSVSNVTNPQSQLVTQWMTVIFAIISIFSILLLYYLLIFAG